jgi:hypothetical protein
MFKGKHVKTALHKINRRNARRVALLLSPFDCAEIPQQVLYSDRRQIVRRFLVLQKRTLSARINSFLNYTRVTCFYCRTAYNRREAHAAWADVDATAAAAAARTPTATSGLSKIPGGIANRNNYMR